MAMISTPTSIVWMMMIFDCYYERIRMLKVLILYLLTSTTYFRHFTVCAADRPGIFLPLEFHLQEFIYFILILFE